MGHYVYIVRCIDNTLYTGYTNNLLERIRSHNERNVGAKYTKSRRPVVLVFSITMKTKQEAMRMEASIKKLTRIQKLELIQKTK